MCLEARLCEIQSHICKYIHTHALKHGKYELPRLHTKFSSLVNDYIGIDAKKGSINVICMHNFMKTIQMKSILLSLLPYEVKNSAIIYLPIVFRVYLFTGLDYLSRTMD